MAQGFQAPAETAFGATDSFGHRPYFAVARRQKDDDPVRLAQFVRPQHDPSVAVERHGCNYLGMPPVRSAPGSRLGLETGPRDWASRLGSGGQAVLVSQLPCPPEAPLSMLVLPHGVAQVLAAEIRPQYVHENELAVGNLP